MRDDGQLGRYKIIKELGRGGFSTVYQAVDTVLVREVALKVLDPLLARDESWVERFRREARSVARLNHPHIVTIYEIGESQGRLFIAMELVEGPSLKDLIAREANLSWGQTLELLEQIARALDYAHGHGVVHRDLKPANILLGEHGAVLTDFGFAKLVGESSMSISLSGGVVGTPHYIAPEVWREQGATPQTDVYSLACIVGEMLTGEMLFPGETPVGVMTRHVIDGPEFPETWPPGAPDGLNGVLKQALAQDPKERLPRAGVFLSALRSLEKPSSLSAEPPRSAEKPSQPPTSEAAQKPSQPLTRTLPQRRPAARRTRSSQLVAPKSFPWRWVVLGAGGMALLACLLLGAIFGPRLVEMVVGPTEPVVVLPSSDTPTLILPTPTQRATTAPETSSGGATFKLGILGPFSGPSARAGEEFRGSATMAFEAIDWQIGNYTIEPVWIDSQSDPAKAAQAYEQAVVQDGIQAGILNWHSSVAVSCMEITAKHEVPHFFGFGATEVVNETFNSDPDYYGYWMYKGWPTPKKLSISYVQALEDAIEQGIWTPESKTVGIYGEDTDWGRSFGAAIAEQFEAAGWEIVGEEYFAIDQTEFYPLLNKFVDQNPAVIAGTSTAAPALSAFIKQADEVGLESLIIADGIGWVGDWYGLTGASSNYVVDQIPGWPTAEAQQFAAEFEERWRITPSPSAAGLAYDGTRFFIAVAQAAYEEYGELTSESIYNFVSENIWTGEWTYTGGIMMEEYAAAPDTVPDPVVGKGYYIFPVLQYFDGEGVVVYPPEWAVQELAAPR